MAATACPSVAWCTVRAERRERDTDEAGRQSVRPGMFCGGEREHHWKSISASDELRAWRVRAVSRDRVTSVGDGRCANRAECQVSRVTPSLYGGCGSAGLGPTRSRPRLSEPALSDRITRPWPLSPSEQGE